MGRSVKNCARPLPGKGRGETYKEFRDRLKEAREKRQEVRRDEE